MKRGQHKEGRATVSDASAKGTGGWERGRPAGKREQDQEGMVTVTEAAANGTGGC